MAGQRIDRHGDPCLRILSHRKLDMHGLDVHVDSRDGPYDPGHVRLVERLAECNPSSIRDSRRYDLFFYLFIYSNWPNYFNFGTSSGARIRVVRTTSVVRPNTALGSIVRILLRPSYPVARPYSGRQRDCLIGRGFGPSPVNAIACAGKSVLTSPFTGTR